MMPTSFVKYPTNVSPMGFQAGRSSRACDTHRAGKPIVRIRHAMTLIELVVSALLAALMMTALSSIVWSSARESRQLGRDAMHRFPTTQLAQQMRVDFANARGILTDSRSITLHGFLGANPATRRPMLTPGRIRYEVTRVAQQSVLIRSTADSREPVWVGCSALLFESFDQLDPEDELLPQPESGGMPNVPASFRLTMLGEDGQVLWRETMHHHED